MGTGMRIGVLGGAFDPPHAAHAALAAAARRQLNLDLILWVPTFDPAHKGGPTASFDHRVAMVRALAGDIPASEVSDIEATLPRPSYTLHTLRALKEQRGSENPDDTWYLILGADNWSIFPRWHQPEAVLAEATLAIYPRAGFPLPDIVEPNFPAVILDFTMMPDQSTEFREALAAPESSSATSEREAALARLPAPVAAYIRAHHLYEGRST